MPVFAQGSASVREQGVIGIHDGVGAAADDVPVEQPADHGSGAATDLDDVRASWWQCGANMLQHVSVERPIIDGALRREIARIIERHGFHATISRSRTRPLASHATHNRWAAISSSNARRPTDSAMRSASAV